MKWRWHHIPRSSLSIMLIYSPTSRESSKEWRASWAWIATYKGCSGDSPVPNRFRVRRGEIVSSAVLWGSAVTHTRFVGFFESVSATKRLKLRYLPVFWGMLSKIARLANLYGWNRWQLIQPLLYSHFAQSKEESRQDPCWRGNDAESVMKILK